MLLAGAIPDVARRTLTWDQGSEMARHDILAEHFEEGVFFADPGSPWQRGTNENTNGLLRQFFPKSKDLSIYTLEDLARAEKLLNNRPRKILNWHTPDLVFTRGLGRFGPCCDDRTKSPLNSPVVKGSIFNRR